MLRDPLFLTYLQIFGLGVVAALLAVVVFVLIFRGSGSGGGLAAVRKYLHGRWTYILGAAVMALGLAKQQGYIDLPTYDRYVEFLTGGALITFKAALARVEARLVEVRAAPPTPASVAAAPPASLTPNPPAWSQGPTGSTGLPNR